MLVNFADSEPANGHRVLQFGNRFDFVIRQQVYAKGNFIMVMAPRGTAFARGVSGGRAGAAAAPQYSKGNNLAIANFTWTAAVDTSAANPRSDYVGRIRLLPDGAAEGDGALHRLPARSARRASRRSASKAEWCFPFGTGSSNSNLRGSILIRTRRCSFRLASS